MNFGLPDDVIVYFLHHTETTDSGKIKAKTVGKMLDSQLTVEGLFSIVLVCSADGGEHKFITQSDGYTTAKSPMEMFDLEIDNDLKMVDQTIREYWDNSIVLKQLRQMEEKMEEKLKKAIKTSKQGVIILLVLSGLMYIFNIVVIKITCIL